MTKFLKVFAVAASLVMVAASAYAQVGVNDIISSAPRWQRIPVTFVTSVKTAAAVGYATDSQAPVTANHTAGTTSGWSAAVFADTTAAIDISNSFIRSLVATSAFDSSVTFPWLKFAIDSPMKNATYADPDTFKVVAQFSQDGSVWTTVDSLTFSMKQNLPAYGPMTMLAGDSTRFILNPFNGALGINENVLTLDNVHPRTSASGYANSSTRFAVLPGAKFVRFLIDRDRSEFPYTTQPVANRYTVSVWLYSNPPYYSQHMNATVR